MSLISSLKREETSLSALESMATGCPDVSTNIGRLADLPTVQANPDAVSFAEKMCELIENYERIRTEQMNFTREHFNIVNWEKAWLEVIEYNNF